MRSTGNEVLLRQLRALRRFIEGFGFVSMKRDDTLLVGATLPAGAIARAISEPGKQYALYIHHSRYAGWIIKELEIGSCYEPVPGDYQHPLSLALPEGRYRLEWVEPATGRRIGVSAVTHGGGLLSVTTPRYRVDVALGIRRR